MAQSRGGSFAGDAQDITVPESYATPLMVRNFLYNQDDNQLECDRDSSDNMSGGTFHFEYWQDDGTTDPVDVADGDWTALAIVSNPASGSVIRTLADQVSGRWFRAWKVTSGGYAGPKTLPIQNEHPVRLCLVKGKIGDIFDASLGACRVYIEPEDPAADFITMSGGKQVLTKKRVVYPDAQGAWEANLYRTAIIGYNMKFTFITRYGKAGPYTKVIPNATEANYVNLVDG